MFFSKTPNAKPSLREQVKRYFQLFFGIVILYIGCHLARQLMEGFPGAGIGFTGLYYYFDASNVYHCGPAYLLTNLANVVMLVTDVYVLTRNLTMLCLEYKGA